MEQQYNIISFDVGIKNMAYCIFSVRTNDTKTPFKILDWNVLNLIEREPPPLPTEVLHHCQVLSPTTAKKNAVAKTCTKAAKYKWENRFFCEKHAKESTTSVFPKDRFSLSQLKKMDLEELHKLQQKYNISITTTKKSAIENLDAYFTQHTMQPILTKKKEKSANDMDLLTLGKHLMLALDRNPHISSITHVIIENQISPIANRMKTVQGMLAQYFIMRVPECKIEFISSSNKLKTFTNKETNKKREHKNQESSASEMKTEYKKHKMDGINYTEQVLQQNSFITTNTTNTTNCWHSHFQSSKKRDDLADAFLQGLWYMINKKWVNIKIDGEEPTRKYIITAENLKINSI